jgi:hypothetical protein
VLAASSTASLPDDKIAHVHAGSKALPSLFSADQKRFLKDCAGIRVNLSMLTLLGPVTAWHWKPIQIRAPDPKLELQAERWTVDHTLDFLELSTRVKPADAEAAKSAFDDLIRRRGFPLDADQENKTQRVLTYLVGNATRTSAGLEPNRR